MELTWTDNRKMFSMNHVCFCREPATQASSSLMHDHDHECVCLPDTVQSQNWFWRIWDGSLSNQMRKNKDLRRGFSACYHPLLNPYIRCTELRSLYWVCIVTAIVVWRPLQHIAFVMFISPTHNSKILSWSNCSSLLGRLQTVGYWK